MVGDKEDDSRSSVAIGYFGYLGEPIEGRTGFMPTASMKPTTHLAFGGENAGSEDSTEIRVADVLLINALKTSRNQRHVSLRPLLRASKHILYYNLLAVQLMLNSKM